MIIIVIVIVIVIVIIIVIIAIVFIFARQKTKRAAFVAFSPRFRETVEELALLGSVAEWRVSQP